MKSKIVLSIVAASVALVPIAAFAKSEKSSRQESRHHVSHPAATPATTAAQAIPAAKHVKKPSSAAVKTK